MRKIFAPLNRWGFIFYSFLFGIAIVLFTHFIMFFVLSADSIILNLIYLEYAIIWFLIFKRSLDIFDKWWKALIFSSIFGVLLVVTFYLSMQTITFDLSTGFFVTTNRPIYLLYPVLFLLLYLFLVFKKGKTTQRFFENWKVILKRTVLLLCIFSVYKCLCVSFDTQLTNIDYRMYPTLELWDRVLVSKLIKWHSLNRGDIVAVPTKYGGGVPLRIVGLPNEEVKLDGNKIYINGELFVDEFAFYGEYLEPIHFQETIHLDGNSYFLIGDNRYYDVRGKIFSAKPGEQRTWHPINSTQEQVYAVVKREDLFGKVIGVHYENFKEQNKQYPNKQIQRSDRSYAFVTKNQKFGFNPSSKLKDIFGKP